MRLELQYRSDLDLSQPAMQVDIRNHIARCLRDFPHGGEGVITLGGVETKFNRRSRFFWIKRTKFPRRRCSACPAPSSHRALAAGSAASGSRGGMAAASAAGAADGQALKMASCQSNR